MPGFCWIDHHFRIKNVRQLNEFFEVQVWQLQIYQLEVGGVRVAQHAHKVCEESRGTANGFVLEAAEVWAILELSEHIGVAARFVHINGLVFAAIVAQILGSLSFENKLVVSFDHVEYMLPSSVVHDNGELCVSGFYGLVHLPIKTSQIPIRLPLQLQHHLISHTQPVPRLNPLPLHL